MKKLFVLIILTVFAFVNTEVKAVGTDPPMQLQQSYVIENSSTFFIIANADYVIFSFSAAPVTKFLSSKSVLYDKNTTGVIYNSPPVSDTKTFITIQNDFSELPNFRLLNNNKAYSGFMSSRNEYYRQRYEYHDTDKGIYLCSRRIS
ncbi:MAG: hypothetical protein L3J56_01010 [Bacteroidales bacterium]|nr:hypothetical protein [Bacteroidales bacterium]